MKSSNTLQNNHVSSSRQTVLTCTSSGFIESFFASSRLHHLSTWKADLSEFVLQHMHSNPQKYRSSSPQEPCRTIMHVDMDCFFASVGIRDRPHLANKPVAVAHATNSMNHSSFSSSEVASCNYEARKRGLKNGMYLGSAKYLAPDLAIIPYEFDKYDAASKELYRVLLNHADYVQAVSCDEAYVDITYMLQQRIGHDQEHSARSIAEEIRILVFEATSCHASVGISHNMLLARLATAKAKPNGVHFVSSHDTSELLHALSISDLPGIGHATAQKCASVGIKTCGDVVGKVSLQFIQKELGERTGETVHRYAHGHDHRVLENKPRQTVGAEINWGIRFTEEDQVQVFLQEFSHEVFHRLCKAGYTAYHVTVNAKKKLYEGM
jgi:DNA repair protein REV1